MEQKTKTKKLLENKIVNSINESMNSLKDTIANAVNELKEDIKANLSALESVKANLRADFDLMNEISCITDDMSISMEMLTDEITDICTPVEEVLDIIDPQEEEEYDDEDYIVVEDTESGEETEYPID